MNEQQIPQLAGALVTHQRHFGTLSTEDAQWVIQNTTEAVVLFADAVKNRVVKEVKKLLERLPIIITLPTVRDFTASEHFVIDVSSKAKVKISGLGANFRKHFLSKVESSVAAVDLTVNKILEREYDPAIVTALGGEAKVEIMLGQFFAAFAKQSNGERGSLLTNGYASVGYIRDTNGVLWAVGGYWIDDGWSFEASPLDDPRGWFDGLQFLSR